jgi:hypothetical protein
MVHEQSRRLLFSRLEEVLGVDEAGTLMEHLPPAGWADLATRQDVDQLRTEMRTEMQSLRYELLAALHQEIAGVLTAQTRMIIFTMAGTIALLGALIIGILGLQ